MLLSLSVVICMRGGWVVLCLIVFWYIGIVLDDCLFFVRIWVVNSLDFFVEFRLLSLVNLLVVVSVVDMVLFLCLSFVSVCLCEFVILVRS